MTHPAQSHWLPSGKLQCSSLKSTKRHLLFRADGCRSEVLGLTSGSAFNSLWDLKPNHDPSEPHSDVVRHQSAQRSWVTRCYRSAKCSYEQRWPRREAPTAEPNRWLPPILKGTTFSFVQKAVSKKELHHGAANRTCWALSITHVLGGLLGRLHPPDGYIFPNPPLPEGHQVSLPALSMHHLSQVLPSL